MCLFKWREEIMITEETLLRAPSLIDNIQQDSNVMGDSRTTINNLTDTSHIIMNLQVDKINKILTRPPSISNIRHQMHALGNNSSINIINLVTTIAIQMGVIGLERITTLSLRNKIHNPIKRTGDSNTASLSIFLY